MKKRGTKKMRPAKKDVPGRISWCVGPVVAEDEILGVELMEGATGETEGAGLTSVPVDVPRGKMKGWLEGKGFVVKRELVRMGTQGAEHGMCRPRVLGIAALELG